MKSPFTQRDWLGLIAGVSFGGVLGLLFVPGHVTGPALVMILLLPPVVLLISPARPLLSWQVPIVTAAVVKAFMNWTRDDSAVVALADAILWCFLYLVLSSPWAIMFHYRSRRFRQLGKTPGIPIAYVGMALLVFVCCALTLTGFVWAVFTDDNDPKYWLFPIYGVLMATGGIVFSLVTERIARKLEIQKLVRGVFELLMIPGVLFLGCFVVVGIMGLFWFESMRPPLDERSVCVTLVGMEALAAMIWLTRLDRREQSSAAPAPSSAQSGS